jgi:hypothetical protein
MSRVPLVRRRPKNLQETTHRFFFSPLGFEITSVQSNLEHQQTRGDHHELRQFGLREFFYSQIRAHIVPQTQARPRRGKEAPPWSWSWFWSSPSPSSIFRAAAYAAPAVLSLILLVLLLGINHDLGRLRTSLDRCGSGGGGAPGPNWASSVPSVTTVTATVVSSGRPTSSASEDPEWEFDRPNSDAPARSTPTSVTMIDVTSRHPAKHDRDRTRPPSGDTSVHGEHDALLPLDGSLLLWPVRIEFPFTREQALEAVEHGLSVAWEILRRLYHFPLDPP